jgi:glyoxylase-like metal-dependent hydrolase (beta-lactamase superfamily II)
MKQLAEDVYMLKGFPPNVINVYVAGGVLIDSATRQAEKRIFKQTEGITLTAHALTHVHPDHQGCSHVVCESLGIPLWVGQDDVPAMETAGGVVGAKAPAAMKHMQERFWVGPPHPVSRVLREGDEVAGFTVLDTPGHTRGHISYWRESDRVLILGDVLNNMNLMTGIPGLNEPPALFTTDPARNRASIRRLAALRPALALFGHGAPLRDPDKLVDFAARMPA